MLKPEDLTARALDNRGVVVLFCLKRDLMLHVVNFELDRIGMDPKPKAVFKELVSSFSEYRTRLNPHPRPDPGGGAKMVVPDLRWQAGWTGSSKEMLRFTENLVFGDTHDLCLKNAIRGGKRSPADAMQTPSVKARMDEIMELRTAEKIKDSASLAADVVPSAPAEAGANIVARDGLTSLCTTTGTEEEGTVFAKRTFHSYVTLYVETESQHDLKLALNSSTLGCLFASQNVTNVLVVFDVKQSAEPSAQPHIRIAPLRDTRLRTLVIGVLNARSEAAGKPILTMLPGDLYVMPDGGRNISNKFRALFVDDVTKTHMAVSRKVHVHRSEDGLTARRRLARHFVKQMETFHLFSGARLRMPKKNKFFSGSSLGDSLVEVPVLLEEELWATDKATKKAIYSSKNFIAVGGRAGSESDDDDDDDEAAVEEPEPPTKKAKTETDTLPIFFHEFPKVLVAEIINLYNVIGVIDLTAGAGTWAKASLDAGIPYFGVTLTLKHQEELSNHLVEYVKAAQLDSTSPLFVRGLASAKDAKKPSGTGGLPPVPPGPKPAGKPKPDPKNKPGGEKKKKKKHKKDSSSSSESDSSSASPAV